MGRAEDLSKEREGVATGDKEMKHSKTCPKCGMTMILLKTGVSEDQRWWCGACNSYEQDDLISPSEIVFVTDNSLPIVVEEPAQPYSPIGLKAWCEDNDASCPIHGRVSRLNAVWVPDNEGTVKYFCPSCYQQALISKLGLQELT